jgi:hypothetical protein
MSLEDEIKTDCVNHTLIPITEAIEWAQRNNKQDELTKYRVFKLQGKEYIHSCEFGETYHLESCENCKHYDSIEEE